MINPYEMQTSNSDSGNIKEHQQNLKTEDGRQQVAVKQTMASRALVKRATTKERITTGEENAKTNPRDTRRPLRSQSQSLSLSKTLTFLNCSSSRCSATTRRSLRLRPSAAGLAALVLMALLELTNHATFTTATGISPESQQTTAQSHISATAAVEAAKYSQPLTTVRRDSDSPAVDQEDGFFRPMIPQDMSPELLSRRVFNADGKYRVFESVDSDLRVPAARSRASTSAVQPEARQGEEDELNEIPQMPGRRPAIENPKDTLSSEVQGLEDLLSQYVENFFNKGQYEPLPGLVVALQQHHNSSMRPPNARGPPENVQSNVRRVRHTQTRADDTPNEGGAAIRVNIPRALESGRLLFGAGLKKILWPVYMGLQILKSLLFALFLPTLIGSFGKLLGKGITSGSAPLFIRPMEMPQELDFKDPSFNFDDDTKFTMTDDGIKEENYPYNHPEASQKQQQFAYNSLSGNNADALSRYGQNEQQQRVPDTYLSALQTIGSASFKNSNSASSGISGGLGGLAGGLGGGGGGIGMTAPMRNKPLAVANVNTFQTFQKVPASSLLLSNYDPFYSPLLSRLDSVFAQLKLKSDNELCREKAICLMYANPAKYAPYSNLVSAQLSRELNELRKPTSDNPDILRFFKYMRAAKDGQDGIDCEKQFDKCTEFKDFSNPAMVSTYHDINKLVQARKFT